MNRIIAVIILAGGAVFSCTGASAQPDIAASVYGTFSGKTTGNNIIQSPSNAAGVLFEVREIRNPLVGFEGTYSYNRSDQNYQLQALPLSCPTSGCPVFPGLCRTTRTRLRAIGLFSVKVANLRPFALAGGGLLSNQPGVFQPHLWLYQHRHHHRPEHHERDQGSICLWRRA